MIASLTAWADAVKVSGNDYIWSCTDHIEVINAEINISGLTLIFATGKRIYANGGTIYVSEDYVDTYIQPATIYFRAASRGVIDLVAGSGKWVGKGLNLHMTEGDIRFNSTNGQTNLQDLTLESETSTNNYFFMILPATAKINVMRVAGFGVSITSGDFSMNPKGIGLVSGNGFAAAKFVANNKTLNHFVVQSSAAKQFNTSSLVFGVTTLNFKDGYVNPLFMGMYPKGNASVLRRIQRTLTLNPEDLDGTNISGFSYRVASDRIIQPAGTTTHQTIK
ncbi:hypothetical protein BJAS_P3974 [Bathymodiolus japonicus methanotrophic gill symbiont]|uniref:hypothetical protein n=1 Tax=Bathymodiolus japonicus methanotrophic gill symbiont TaxID=113269 RepID=UPI001B69F2EF|nr:hypothetical protein [Bathymodiolus japonicus methanotrophic gill symbiont]GFO73262.1 hypothetical protein BJAS_P3974 [Bathymodiolus japonicus methanotrophic gill symbiont]